MPTYAIGDVQGCLKPLEKLLALIKFNPQQDTLWFVGDLINRGPQSLETLRFIKNLGDKHISVLGNHDLHFLAVAYGVQPKKKHDTLKELLHAPDRQALVDWLVARPLLHSEKGFTMAHAGIAPVWTLAQATALARELESILQSDQAAFYLQNMYGNMPERWDDNLQGVERFRCAINYFTRMRYCFMDGSLDLEYKGKIADKPEGVMPWFQVPHRKSVDTKILFGHWAALEGESNTKDIYALDTGCVWGRCLTALRLEDEKRFSVKCIKD